MGILITAEFPPPVTVGELTDHLRLDPQDTQAALMEGLIASATQYIEGETGQRLRTTSVSATMSAALVAFEPREIRLPFIPLASVESVTYRDPAGILRTLPTDAYAVDTTRRPGRIVLNDGFDWPLVVNAINAVEIAYTAGYVAGQCPPILKQAVLMLAAHWFANREAVVTGTQINQTPLAVESIIAQYRYLEAV